MIKFSTVTKQFGDGTVALRDVSFIVEPGELVVITGPSGSGKTTLMKLLIRELLPTEGEIIFQDQPLAKLRSSQIPQHRRQVGVVFQDYKLLPELNVWENIALPLSIVGKTQTEIESRVTDLLKLTSLADKALLFPSQLSGGEAQRVSIARALATGPSVIFADEPTGNLDQNTSQAISQLLKKINQLGTTLLFATHDVVVLNELKKDRHLNLNKGELTQDTRPAKSQKTKIPQATIKTSQTSEEKPQAETTTKEATNKEDSPDEKTKTKLKPQTTKKPRFRLDLPKIKLPFSRKTNEKPEKIETKVAEPPVKIKVESLAEKDKDKTPVETPDEKTKTKATPEKKIKVKTKAKKKTVKPAVKPEDKQL